MKYCHLCEQLEFKSFLVENSNPLVEAAISVENKNETARGFPRQM